MYIGKLSSTFSIKFNGIDEFVKIFQLNLPFLTFYPTKKAYNSDKLHALNPNFPYYFFLSQSIELVSLASQNYGENN